MENTIRITKTKDNRYYISVKKYRFLLFPYWDKLTYLTDNKKEEVMLFSTKDEAKEFLDYIYI